MLSLFFAFATAHAAEKRTPFLVVLEFRVENKAVPIDVATTMSSLVRSRIVGAAKGVVKLIGSDRVNEILMKSNKTAASCTADCEIERRAR